MLKLIVMTIAGIGKLYVLFSRFVCHEASMMACGVSYKAALKDEEEEFNSIRSVYVLVCSFTGDPK